MESKTELQELSAKFFFSCPGFQHTGLLVTSTALGFLHVQLPLWVLSPSWASDVFGLPLMGTKPRLFQLG